MKVENPEFDKKFHGIFIRAPGIVSIDNKELVKVLATLPYGSDVQSISMCENIGKASIIPN